MEAFEKYYDKFLRGNASMNEEDFVAEIEKMRNEGLSDLIIMDRIHYGINFLANSDARMSQDTVMGTLREQVVSGNRFINKLDYSGSSNRVIVKNNEIIRKMLINARDKILRRNASNKTLHT